MPLYHADILNSEIGGFNLNGHIYGLGASSGIGKSSMAFNWVIASAITQGERVVLIVNEEDAKRTRKDLLIWVANNIFKEELHKRTLRDGNFTEDTLNLLKKCADWLDKKKEEHILTVIALERYSVDIAIKVIKKYASAFGCRVFILDTLKESFDAKTDEIYKSMMRDMVKLYDTIKPSSKNVGLFVTYQLGKGSLKMRYLTNNEIGQAKSIVDVMSVNLMMRRPYEDEYEGNSKELTCYRLEGANNKTKIPFKLRKENNPMITFVTKNRFGATGVNQVVSECNLSTNICKDVGICNVPQDF
jgi:replicative DNA helicase